jgi:hypothetical protein
MVLHGGGVYKSFRVLAPFSSFLLNYASMIIELVLDKRNTSRIEWLFVYSKSCHSFTPRVLLCSIVMRQLADSAVGHASMQISYNHINTNPRLKTDIQNQNQA